MGTLRWSNQFRVRSGVAPLLVSGLVVLTALPAFSQSIRWFPEINPTSNDSGSLAWDVSADGQVIVGSIRVSDGFRPFRWTRDGGYQLLADISGGAFSISADGRVVVGFVGSPNRAFRWTETEGLQLLPTLGNGTHSARGVSADGSVIVGVGVLPGGGITAVRWTAAGIESIAPGGQAWGVSADGTVVAGGGFVGGGLFTAFRWTETGGLQTLSGVATAFAWDVSADGSTVVGFYQTAGGSRAFRWRPDSGAFQDLGTLGGRSSIAFGTNNDGSAVLGLSEKAGGGARAFIWTEAEGMRDLNEVFPEAVSDGSVLISVRAVSLDGRYIVGWGDRPNGRREAFVLDTWRSGAARPGNCVDDDDLLAVLFAFGTRGTGYTRHEDINKDGIVDDRDLLIVLSNFRRGCQ
ncbi:MAG: hypothetical protein NZ874_03520 [Fimbriimonadales bacterium]|nr:hypothetical protein [Fimbriimonadales bacterium]